MTIIFCDCRASGNLLYSQGWSVSATECHLHPGAGNSRLNNHMDGSNFCLADGHVRWLKRTTANKWRRIKQPAGGVQDPAYKETSSHGGSRCR